MILGKFPRRLGDKLVFMEKCCRWLKSGDIKGGTESTIVAAQDQPHSTSYFKKYIVKEEGKNIRRLRKEYGGTIDNLTSGY
jgi:hypothetical protein